MKTHLRSLIGIVVCLTLVLSGWLPQGRPTMAATPPAAGGPPIRLAAMSFDPLTADIASDQEQGLYLAAFPGDGLGYYLVQFSGPITAANVNALKAAGAEVFDYIPEFAFIVKMNAAAQTKVAALSGVRWVGLYQPAYRLASDLLPYAQAAQPGRQSPGAHSSANLTSDAAPLTLAVSVFRGESLAAAAAEVEALGGVVLDQSETAWQGKLKVTLPSTALADLAAFPGVRWIEAAPQWELHNDKADNVMGVREVWSTHGLYGAGQTVAVCDTGLDQGSTSPGSLHDDFENGSGVSRVTALLDRVGDGAEDRNSGHGSHVAGSVLGNGDLSGATPGTHTYPEDARVGMAPEANLVFQAVENDAGELVGIPNDLNELFSQAASNGANLHTDSWGADVGGAYTSDSEAVDQYMWDHKNFAILFSAANAGVDADANGVVDLYSLGSPATAKNCITVGASENDRPSISTTWGQGWPDDFTVDPINSDPMANNTAGLAAFSSRGPTLDGRYKPDIVAPGSFIASVRSSLATETGWGVIDANYMYMGGTSMATPLTAGAMALIRQFYTDNEGVATPSAALLKATLINGATDINPGQYGTGGTREIPTTRPTNVAGWGRVNIENSIFPSGSRVMTYTDNTAGLSTGQTRSYNYYVGSSAEPLRVTLAWTDYPGSPASSGALVNDLDLKVVGPTGTTYYPNNANAAGDYLSYDDGMLTNVYYWDGGRVAVRFTPITYPATLKTGLFYLASKSQSYPKTFTWYVYSGSTSGPATQLASGTSTLLKAGFHAIDFSAAGVNISSGDFFLAIDLPDDDLLWGYDDTAPSQRSWDYNGSAWSQYNTADYMFHAIVSSGSAQQDRVNNVEGIDIASPATGLYTVTVTAYNVPQGPQPYAVVASGAMTLPSPILEGIPDQVVPVNGSVSHAIDLWEYVQYAGSYSDLAFSIYSQIPIGAGLDIEYHRYVNIDPDPGFEGVVNVIMEVIDINAQSDTDAFQVIVTSDNITPTLDLPAQNLSANATRTLDLWDYAEDRNDGVEVLTFTIESVTPPEATLLNFDATLTGTHYLNLDAGTWNGLAYVTVLTEDPGGLSTSSTMTVAVSGGTRYIYLPLVTRRYPPIPYATTLSAISNSDGDGSYTVSWSAADLATSYQLQEATNAAFTGATTVYNGAATFWGASGKTAGTYYYRVRGQNSYGYGAWSNVQSVRVLPPSLFYSSADTVVKQGASGSNFGAADLMGTGYDHCGSGQVNRSLVRFDLSAIPSGTGIANATLSLYLSSSCDYATRSHVVTTYRVTGDWSEYGVTWNTQPPSAEAYGSTAVVSRDAWGWYDFNVTTLVQGWINGGYPNYGLTLRSNESSGDAALLEFDTYESGYIPRLRITYTGMAVTAEENTVELSPVSPTLKAPTNPLWELWRAPLCPDCAPFEIYTGR